MTSLARRVLSVARATVIATASGLLLLLVACTASPGAAVTDAGAPPADGTSTPTADTGVPLDDAGPGADAAVPSDAGAAPVPVDRAPCTAGRCWATSASPVSCASRAVDEDFASGRYDVHAYATTFHAGTDTRVTLLRTGGTFAPALVVTDRDGTTLSDGAVGAVSASVHVTVEADGRVGDTARVVVRTDHDVLGSVFVTGWTVVDSGFTADLPTDVTYRLTVESLCSGVTTVPCVVNGHAVPEPACGWLHYFAREVVPRLDGTRDERLPAAARVGWWSLKEGTLGLANPFVFSLCNFTSGDARIGPLETCTPGRAWQVGIASVQVPGPTLTALEATAARLFPGESSSAVLVRAASEAELDAATTAAVVASTGDLRRSWLLRTSAVGVTYEAPTVAAECVTGTRSWCYGSGWDTTRLYAPTRAAALGAIDDVRMILSAVAP